jgi:DNA-binding MarR family transcriptional regulator
MAKTTTATATTAPASRETFRNSLFYWTGLLEDRYNQDFVKAMRPLRVTVPRFRTLAVLMELSDLTVNELARHSSIERSALSRLLDQLEGEGLIVRRQKSADKRALAIRITDAGRAAYRTMRPVRREVLRRATDGIAPEDVELMLSVVQRMLRNLEGGEAPRTSVTAPLPPTSSRRKPGSI